MGLLLAVAVVVASWAMDGLANGCAYMWVVFFVTILVVDFMAGMVA